VFPGASFSREGTSFIFPWGKRMSSSGGRVSWHLLRKGREPALGRGVYHSPISVSESAFDPVTGMKQTEYVCAFLSPYYERKEESRARVGYLFSPTLFLKSGCPSETMGKEVRWRLFAFSMYWLFICYTYILKARVQSCSGGVILKLPFYKLHQFLLLIHF
jgi:hypothetical protein